MKFEQIFDNWWVYLFTVAKESLPEDEAEDCVSHAFITLWKHREDVPIDKVKAYLIIILKNKIRSTLHYLSIEGNKLAAYRYLLDEEQEDLDHVKSEVLRSLLIEGINLLPKKSKRIMFMVLEGVHERDIAAQLNLSPQTIWNTKVTAIKRLREYMLPRLQFCE